VAEPSGKKKIFISWSKSYSKAVALVLERHLPELLDGIDIFMSDKDIDPGQRSMKVLEQQLADTSYGLLVVTSENQSEPWLNFEAGALSRQVSNDLEGVPLIVPLLVDIDTPTQLTGPISQFQAVRLDESGLNRVARQISALTSSDPEMATLRLKRAWNEISRSLTEARGLHPVHSEIPPRSVEDKIDEALVILRNLNLFGGQDIPGIDRLIEQSILERESDLLYSRESNFLLGAKVVGIGGTDNGLQNVDLMVPSNWTDEKTDEVRSRMENLLEHPIHIMLKRIDREEQQD
jgi:hypothetical protein